MPTQAVKEVRMRTVQVQTKFNVTAYRHSHEALALAVAVLTLAGLVLVLGWLSLGVLLALLPLLFWFTAVFLRIEHHRYLGNAVRVSGHQLPEIAQQAARVAAVLHAPPFEVLVVESPVANAYAFGWWYPQAVVVTSALVDMMTPDELRFVLGHEVGHILLGHTRVGSLMGGLLGVPQVPVLSLLGGWAFRWWSRLAEYSADRLGLLACGDLRPAERALTKLLVGARLAKRLNLEQVLDQADELVREWSGSLGESLMPHPYLVRRLKALRTFWAKHHAEIQERILHAGAQAPQEGPCFGFWGAVPKSWMIHYRPAVNAAVRWMALYLLFALISLITGWASLVVTLFLQLITGVVAAGQAAIQARRMGLSARRVWMQSLVAVWLLLGGVTALIIAIAAVAGFGSVGVLVPVMVPYLVVLPGVWIMGTLLAFGMGWIITRWPVKQTREDEG